MRGSSRTSLHEATDRLEPVLRQEVSTPGAVPALAAELLNVTRLFDTNTTLRRSLSDPSRGPEVKGAVANQLLADKVSPISLDVIAGVVRSRWTSPPDLTAAVEYLGVTTLLSDAERQNQLDQVEDELFRLSRTIEHTPDLQRALNNGRASSDLKVTLLNQLLSGKSSAQTAALAEHAVRAPRGRRVERALEEFTKIAAERRGRKTAVVTSAVPLSETQRSKLENILELKYGRKISVTNDVNPELVGGLKITIGDDVIDASTLTQLESARRKLAG